MCVALGYLFLDDERQRPAVPDGLRRLGVPAATPRSARPEAATSPEWVTSNLPNVHVEWRAGGLKLRWPEPDGPYLGILGTCRICERPAGQFRTPICSEQLAYCHRCLAIAADGLPNMASTVDRATARATVAVRALAQAEFGGAAFVEAQLATIHGDRGHPVAATDIDRRLLLRIAITRGQLAWTRILIDAGLADNGLRLSRGTILKAVDGHFCVTMQEKAVDDFLHQHSIDHAREPLYPFDKQLNPNTRRRADWLLSDGTFVELWGMPNDPTYTKKICEKTELAARHRLQLIGLTSRDIGRLSEIFAHWATK